MTAATPGQAADWWVCDGPLPAGGRKITGPFATQELALTVRAYVEKAEGRTDLWVDDELAAQEPHAAPKLAELIRSWRDSIADLEAEPMDLANTVEVETLRTVIRQLEQAAPATEQPAPGLAALRQAAARELVTAADRDQLSAELGKLKQLLDDFTHAVIDLDDGARLVGIDRLAKAAHAVREKAGLPVIDQFSHPAGPPA